MKAGFEHIHLSIKIIEMMLDELERKVLKLHHASTAWGIGVDWQI